MPTFEADIRGQDASRAGEQLAQKQIKTERLPGGIVIATLEAASAAAAEERIEAILDVGSIRISIRRAGGRERPAVAENEANSQRRGEPGGADPGAHPFDNEVHPAAGDVESSRGRIERSP